MNSGVYAIVNIANDRCYIGSAINLYKRWHSHRHYLNTNKHANSYLQRAYNKYGNKTFIYTVLEYVEPDKIKLLERENYWILILKVCNRSYGYNIRLKAENCLGVKRSDETKAKMSLAQKGRKLSQEQILKMSIRMNGRISPNKGKVLNESHKEKLAKLRLGTKHSEETKSKISLNNKGKSRKPDKWPCPEGRNCNCRNCKNKRNEYLRNWRKPPFTLIKELTT